MSYDLEMCTNFPYWTSVWDDRKGAIDEDNKRYVGRLLEVAEEFRAPLHFWILGSSLEDPDVDYLRRAVAEGHAIGNHTYTHVNVKATTVPALQVVYRNEPWRAAGRPVREVQRGELRMTWLAIQERLGVATRAFHTPGGFAVGLADSPAFLDLLEEEGTPYVGSHYSLKLPREVRPTIENLRAAVVESVSRLQPYRYAAAAGESITGSGRVGSGLLEIPSMGVSDVWAFRHFKLDKSEWLAAMRAAVEHARDEGLVLSLHHHPPVLAARDPFCETLELCLRLAREGDAWIATNDELAAWYGGGANPGRGAETTAAPRETAPVTGR
jgi:peptidoglycan/xylan/chitin deacetylase (PgdA/CDA1 family)